jgi:N-ethylmaleimide reductase
MKLFEPYKLGNIELKNRVVMAPMTRNRAIGNVPNELMATYYRQRFGAGLIITEGISPSPNGLGYARIPGIYSKEQVLGWKRITDAVHEEGGKIFAQFMHTGRVGHPLNLPAGAILLAPSAIRMEGPLFTDQEGLIELPEPKAMSIDELRLTRDEYIQAARNAIEAGFDGVELHGANGYLLEQFISPQTNQRTDEYGGSIENRCRFVVEVAEGVVNAIGKERTAIRFSPFGVNAGMKPFSEVEETYIYLAEQMNNLGIVYIHLVDHSAMGAPEVPDAMKSAIRDRLKNTLILSGGYDKERAETDLQSGFADLVAFGRPFINNPDFVQRMMNDWPLNTQLDFSTFYSAGEKGYTDYPVHSSIV